jgi:hypothetical protein
MKKLLLFIVLVSCNSFSQNNELNKLFFNIPLYSSRDSIYNFFDNATFITKEKNKYRVTKNGIEIKTFNGYHNKIETVDKKIDSIHFKLSTGSKSKKGESNNKNLIVVSLNYKINDKRISEDSYEKIKEQIIDVLKLNPTGSNKDVDNKKKKIGISCYWILENEEIVQLEYRIINKKEYKIRIEFNRIE